ncbi:MAG: GxxExxY protein [Candidatus Acidiferrales bacterium]
MDDINSLTEKIIGCAIEVHRELGPGLLEVTYEEALCIELGIAGLKFGRQVPFPVLYKGRNLGEYRLDLIVEDKVIVEIKSVERFASVFEAQISTYLKATNKKVGLLVNFNNRLLHDGVKGFII